MFSVTSIKLLIAQDQIEKAFQRLLEYTGDLCNEQVNDLVLLSREFNAKKKIFRRGLMKQKQYQRERQGLAYRLLLFLDDCQNA